MISSDNLRRLHFINALFAGVTGDDLYLAQQIHAAIAASLDGGGAPAAADTAADTGTDEPAFAAAAARLRERLGGGRQDHGFYWWDAAAAEATPLFTRQRVLDGLKRLAGYREGTLLVTSFRPAHCPPHRRWTRRRRHDLEESLALIQNLAATRTRRSAGLRLLVV